MKIGPIQPPKVRLPEQTAPETKTPESGRSRDLDRFESAKRGEASLSHLLGEAQRGQVSDGQRSGDAQAKRSSEAAERFEAAAGKTQEAQSKLGGMKTLSIVGAVAATTAAVVVATTAFGAAGLAAGAIIAAGGLTGGLEGSRLGQGNPFDPDLAAELRKGAAQQSSAISAAVTSAFTWPLELARKKPAS